MIEIQRTVAANLKSRGYLNGDRREEMRSQVIKAVEELGEVARQVFDGKEPDVHELADACIPLFALSYLVGDTDLVGIILYKSKADVERGVRNG